MTTNVQGTRPSSRPGEPAVVEPKPVITPTGVGGVAVYDAAPNPAKNSSSTMLEDPAPIEGRSSNSILTWVISAIVLIVLAYFLLQIIL